MMTTEVLNAGEVAEFWRVARRLHAIYAELDHTFELGQPPCADLEKSSDSPQPEARERVREWFETMDSHTQVWQLRQLLQSTSLQNEENLRYLIRRHLDRKDKTESDKEKIDFLLVQYFAHCAPHGLNEQNLTLDEVAEVLQPILGALPETYPDWAPGLDDKLQKLNECNSLEELQNSGALLEVRELKLAIGDKYFDSGTLVAFTRFNFRARSAFFKAMHLDLHAIRAAVNELEKMGYSTLDCREAGLSESESLDQVRHVVHQWKTPFRAPYSGGSSFLQLILLRHALRLKLNEAYARHAGQGGEMLEGSEEAPPPLVVPVAAAPEIAVAAAPEIKVAAVIAPEEKESSNVQEIDVDSALVAPEPLALSRETVEAPAKSTGRDAALMSFESAPPPPPPPPPPPAESVARANSAAVATKDAGDPANPAPAVQESQLSAESNADEDDDLQRCVRDISAQLAAVPPKNSPSVSAISLGGCKLLIATWEAEAFIYGVDDLSKALKRTVAARTILHVCLERHRKNEPTDVAAALEIAQVQSEKMQTSVADAKEQKDIDAAVNLAATNKRLLALIEEAKTLIG